MAARRLPFRALRYSNLSHRFIVAAVLAMVRVFAALPTRWVLRLGDAIGTASCLLHARGRRTARQNLRAVFGNALTSREQRAIHRASARQSARSGLLLLHLQPLDRKRFLDLVELPPNLVSDPAFLRMRERGAVLVSGHVGNWELLLGANAALPELPPVTFFAEQAPHRAINEVLARLRKHDPKVTSVFRRGGAQSSAAAVAKGGVAALLVDRNVRGALGGVYVPFLGLLARTTPLPALLAERYGAPVHPVFCLPNGGERYRLWIGPDLSAGLEPGSTPEASAAFRSQLLERMNDAIEEVVRARPDLWSWTLKRFKSRPTVELGRYPAYSLFDPDEPRTRSPESRRAEAME